jgi:FkbM family methyltransferase
MRKLLSDFFDGLCNWWLTRQRPGRWAPLDKAELREMTVTFSQFGEDIAVQRIAAELGITRGFYVNAGAFHPIRGSNTLLLHKAGWRGINIEMVPEKVRVFEQLRPLDRNVCAALDREEHAVYFSSDQASMDRVYAEPSVTGLKAAQARTLNHVLAEAGHPSRTIDYLDIDCEGLDLRVLQGLDLTRYPVRILTIEALDATAEREITNYLTARGMVLVEQIKWTLVFTKSFPRSV